MDKIGRSALITALLDRNLANYLYPASRLDCPWIGLYGCLGLLDTYSTVQRDGKVCEIILASLLQ